MVHVGSTADASLCGAPCIITDGKHRGRNPGRMVWWDSWFRCVCAPVIEAKDTCIMSEEVIVARESENLTGTIKVSGAKNSALKLIAAAILGRGASVIHNVPLISDIEVMSDVARAMGAEVVRTDHTLTVDTTNVQDKETPYALVSKMRASISVLGPMVGRFGHARVSMPGGCQIGARKIDMHLVGMSALGVQFNLDHGVLEASVPDGLHGNDVCLEFPSVGATENTMMTAVVANGHTTLENAAREPEIVDLANMLNSMGCKVSGAGNSTIEIEGVPLESLHPCEHTTVGDRIEAGTFLVGGALLGGPLTVTGIDPSFLRMAILKLRAMGCDVDYGDDWISIRRTGRLKPVDIQTLPHPGFPTDLQAQFMLLCSLADGSSVVTENVFENRFMFAEEIMRMGADITIDGHHAIVEGVDRLEGAPVSSTDLRGGAALVLAGLAAEGETIVRSIGHIDRGYEDYVGKLRHLGADVERCLMNDDGSLVALQ
jgi:UDP-N-acetylglucosamine 1-carboxyvinyltransferase